MTVRRAPFGTLPDGRAVEVFTLVNRRGMTAEILTYGGTLLSLLVPDRDRRLADVVLGYGRLDDYVHRNQYFGALIGRYANRVGGGRFTLDGREHAVDVNQPPNALHGGEDGFDKAVWQASSDDASVRLTHHSPDGTGGYPGTLDVAVTYRLTDAGGLRIEYLATTDRPTVLNLTNHAYWNLAGEGSGDVLDHELTIDADAIVAVDETLIPTGELRPVAGTPFDFREPHRIGDRIRDGHDPQLMVGRGYDHCYVLRPSPGAEPFRAARIVEPRSGRVMEVFTTEPGVQLYTGNQLLGNRIGKSGRAYRQSDALCLETQHFPDSPNHPGFPSTVLRPGETFTSATEYRFSIATA
ncbi:MAG TPA: aldose epimerase family protein [Stellaceae bacterium]|nr:aldose epimerase family protein [Stellaceae bacterium]